MTTPVSTTLPTPSMTPAVPARKGKPRGFAALKAQGQGARVREIASHGGRRSVELGRNHHWTSDEARAAGRLGGASRAKRYYPRDAGDAGDAQE